MKFKELTQMTEEEQKNKLRELELELIKLNAQVATGTPPKNAGQIKVLKKDFARLMLIINTKKKISEAKKIQTKTSSQEKKEEKKKQEKMVLPKNKEKEQTIDKSSKKTNKKQNE